MKSKIILILFIGLIIGCQSKNETTKDKDYEIILDGGIYVEKFDSTNTSENRYTANNKTYIEGNKLTYDYYYQDLNGEKYKFQEVAGAGDMEFKEMVKAWFFVPIDSVNEKTINHVIITVKHGLYPMINSNPDYNQTVISFNYPQINGKKNFSSSTGLIENEKNIWAHPPREKFFRILELNPFPFIQAPYEIGNTWDWSLKIGSFWGDERWKIWDGSIENKYKYEITGKVIVDSQIGEVECYEIKSTATSSIGATHLMAYFNEEIGFVKLKYTNIESTKTVLDLVKFEKRNVK